MNSMTGFGKAEGSSRLGTFTVELTSVNSRFLEVSVRLPRQFSALEHRVRERISERLNRGKIFVFAGYAEPDNGSGRNYINGTAMAAVSRQLQQLKNDLKLTGEITVSDLLVFPDVTRPVDESLDDDKIWAVMQKVVDKALTGLLTMRRREGAAMMQDMRKRLLTIERLNRKIAKNAPMIVGRYRTRLENRLKDFVTNGTADSGRLEQEIAYFADRCDITEECTRLTSHIKQYRNDLKQTRPVGKRVNFLLQEMNREANTMASKAIDTKITSAVISLKEEMEKLRELVQNVE